MNDLIVKVKNAFWVLASFAIASPVLASLPTPASDELISSGKSAIDVGGTIFFKLLKYGCYITAIAIVIGTASIIFGALKKSHEKEEVGHFIKYLLLGLLCIAIAFALVYAGYAVIPSGGDL